MCKMQTFNDRVNFSRNNDDLHTQKTTREPVLIQVHKYILVTKTRISDKKQAAATVIKENKNI